MVEVIFSHESALAHWSGAGVRAPGGCMPAELVSAVLEDTGVALRSDDLKVAREGFGLGGMPEPQHLLVADAGKRRKLKGVRFHCEELSLPAGSLVQVSRHQIVRGTRLLNLSCVSPELMFCQLAPKMDFLELLELGYKLCGSYEDGGPASSVALMRERIGRLAGARGSKQAGRAMKYVLDNSWSPKESQIAIMLVLPRRMGGFGVEAPLLNHEIEAPDEVRRVLGETK